MGLGLIFLKAEQSGWRGWRWAFSCLWPTTLGIPGRNFLISSHWPFISAGQQGYDTRLSLNKVTRQCRVLMFCLWTHKSWAWNTILLSPASDEESWGWQPGELLRSFGTLLSLGSYNLTGPLVAVPCHPWVPRCSLVCSSTAVLSCHFTNTVPQALWRQGKCFFAGGPAANIHVEGWGEAGVIGDTPLNQTTALPDSSPL